MISANGHDKADSATLSAGGLASVNYTDKPINVAPALKDIDVLVQTSNQNMKDGLLRQAIMDFADAGKGLVLVHPALWYAGPTGRNTTACWSAAARADTTGSGSSK